MVTNQEIAKDFVSAFITSGIIKTPDQAVDNYFKLLQALSKKVSSEPLPESKSSEPYDPFKSL